METETSKSANGRAKKDGAKEAKRRTYRFKCEVPLTDAQIAKMNDDLLLELQTTDDLLAKKKGLTADIGAEITLSKKRSSALRNGIRARKGEADLECYDDTVYDTNTIYVRRCDTEEIVGPIKGRAMTQEERQVGLALDPKATAATKSKDDDGGIVDENYGKTNKERAASKKASKPEPADAGDDGEF